MKSSLNAVFLIGLCLYVSACAFKKEDAEDKQRQDLANEVTKQMQEDMQNAGVTINSANVSVLTEDGSPGHYTLKIKWPETVGTMDVYINEVLVETVSGRNYFSKDVLQGEILNIKLRAFASVAQGGRFLSEFSDRFEVPRDLIFRNTVELKSNYNESVHRIYFWPQGKIKTNGFTLKLKADLLVVEEDPQYQTGLPEQDAHITSELSPLNENQDIIKIDATKAIGNLTLTMVGLDGANGRDGAEYAYAQGIKIEDTPAAPGAPGKDAVGKLGRPCPGGVKECVAIPPSCNSQPTNGDKGADGLPGQPGEAGHRGGDTGNAYIKIANDEEFAIEIYQISGKGGLGGKGSAGQPGGAGGAPGKNAGNCTQASPGPRGQDGINGADGDNASDGKFGIIDTNVKKVKTTQRAKR